MSTIDRRESMRRVMGGTQDPTVDARRESMRRVLSPPPQYVAGGPGGIPGAKDGLPTPQPDPWSFGAPGGEAPASQYGLDTIRSIMAFKKQVKSQGGDIDGKSDAEVLDLMRKFGPNPGATASDYQPQTTAADEFGRGLRRGIAYGLPAGLPGVEAMRENEQVQRAPEGFAGVAGQTLGGFSGLLDPGKAPENFGAIVFTGGVGRLAAGTLDVIGKNVAESLGKEAGARAVNMIREAIENAGQGGGMAALNELGNIPIDDWKSKPGESTMRVLKAAGIGAAAGMGLGAAFGAASKEARPVPRGTLPERVFDRMLTADEVQQARMGAASAQEGRGAMLDAANVYAAAPRANEMDPQIIAAARQADQMAMDQARASARAIDESTPAPVREPTPAQETSSEVPEAQGQGRQEGLLSPEQPTPEAKAPAVDSLSYAELRARAKELGVFDGSKTRAALAERVKAAETNRTTQTYSESDSRSTQDQRAPQVGTGDTQTYKSGAGIQSTTPTDIAGTSEGRTSLSYATEGSASAFSSPNPTRQPWEMTKAEWNAKLTPTARATFGEFQHRNFVLNALASDEPVPTHVVAEYPGIESKAREVKAAAAESDRRTEANRAEYAAKEEQRKNTANAAYQANVDRNIEALNQHNAYLRDEAWKKTKAEYVTYKRGGARQLQEGEHRESVETAFSEGRPVPPEVLADYPDLAAKAKPVSSSKVDRISEKTLEMARDVIRHTKPGEDVNAKLAERASGYAASLDLGREFGASELRPDQGMAMRDAMSKLGHDLRSGKTTAHEVAGKDWIPERKQPKLMRVTPPDLSRIKRGSDVFGYDKETGDVVEYVATNPPLKDKSVIVRDKNTLSLAALNDGEWWDNHADADHAAVNWIAEREFKSSSPYKPPTPAEAGTTLKPPRDGWTLELEGSGRRYWRSPDGKEIAREDGSMLRFESKAHVWDNGGKERMAKAIGASTESTAKAIQDVPTTRPPSTVAELKESLVRVQKSQGKRYASKMQSEWMKNRGSWGVSPYDDLEEYRSAGYVTRSNDGSKYTLLVVSGTDTPKWRIASKIDVTDQFVKSPDAAPLPTEAARGTTPAGTAAGPVEAPKASAKPTAQQIIAESSDKRSALQRILDQEDGPALWSDHQLIRPNGKYEIKDGKLVKVQDLSKTGFEKNLRDHIDAGEPGRWWNANRSALERMDQIRAEDEAKASAIQESRRIEREKQIAEPNRQAEYRSELEAEVSGSRFSRKDVDVTFNDPNEPKKTVKMQVFGGIGVWKDPDGGYVATHVSSGKRLFAFDSLGKAKAFAVRASKIVDFSKSAEELVKSTDQYTYGLLSDAAKDPFSPPSTYKPIVDYPGTGQGTAPKEGTAGTAAKEAPEPRPQTSGTDEQISRTTPGKDGPTSSSLEGHPSTDKELAPSEGKSLDSERVRPSPSESAASSHDFTARRVVNKPEPGEPEGPVTSARNAMMDEDRFALGLDAADGPERRSWQSALDTAVARKIPDDALGIAAEVNAKPRPLDDIETAGLVYKANELKNRHRELMNEIGGTKDESVIRDRAIKAARIEDEFDTLSTALRKAGTEQGRALASRKLTLREDYSLVAIKSRAKAAAGRELTPAENAKFEAMSKSLEDASTKIASLEKELADLHADSTIKRHAASKRGIPKEAREKIIVDLAANVRQLIESGCR